MQVYLALDGTADIDALKRAREAARMGHAARVCTLPEDKDPDDLSADALAAVKAASTTALDAWLKLLTSQPAGQDTGPLRAEFGRALAEWISADPSAAGAIREQVCAALKLTEPEFHAWTGPLKPRERKAASAASPKRTANPERSVPPDWLDHGFPSELAQIASKDGSARDEAAAGLFVRLSDALHGTEPVTKDRIKEATCERLNIGRRAYEQQLKAARQKLAEEAGRMGEAEGVDWAFVADQYLVKLRAEGPRMAG